MDRSGNAFLRIDRWHKIDSDFSGQRVKFNKLNL